MGKQLHLDSEYRRRWEEFHMADGTVEDSRLKNWRHVEWEKVTRIDVYMNGQKHSTDCVDKSSFLCFMNFRQGGQVAQYNNRGEFTGHKPVNIWTVGWTDGTICHLMDIDFHTGNFEKQYNQPLKELKSHIHPRINMG